jgi:hypothetical protein
MAYTNDPTNVPSDRVRFLVSDTTSSPDLTDEEIAFLLDEESGNAYRAAARAAEVLAAKYSTTAGVERTVGPLRIKTNGFQSRDYLSLAKSLWARAARYSGGVAPYAGGISYADKSIRVANLDRTAPAFSREMMEYEPGDVNRVGTSLETQS